MHQLHSGLAAAIYLLHTNTHTHTYAFTYVYVYVCTAAYIGVHGLYVRRHKYFIIIKRDHILFNGYICARYSVVKRCNAITMRNACAHSPLSTPLLLFDARAVKLAPFTMFNMRSLALPSVGSRMRERGQQQLVECIVWSCALCSHKFSIAKTMLSSCMCVCVCVCMYATKSRLLVSLCVCVCECVSECLRVSCGLLSIWRRLGLWRQHRRRRWLHYDVVTVFSISRFARFALPMMLACECASERAGKREPKRSEPV